MVNTTALVHDDASTRTETDPDERLRRLTENMLDHAIRRQCWLMFLSESSRPVEMIIPIEQLPFEPDDDVAEFAAIVSDIMDRSDAVQLAVVWERVGGPESMPAEQLWIVAVDDAFRNAGLRVRAQMIAYDDGVRMVDVDAVRATVAAESSVPSV